MKLASLSKGRPEGVETNDKIRLYGDFGKLFRKRENKAALIPRSEIMDMAKNFFYPASPDQKDVDGTLHDIGFSRRVDSWTKIC